MSSKLKQFADDMSAAKQVGSLLALAAAGVISVTLLYSQVDATGEKANKNEQSIEVLKKSLSKIATQQQVIIQRLDSEEEKNKEFRNRTDRSLDRILDKLTPRTDTRMRPN